MSNFTQEELNDLLSSFQKQEVILRTIIPSSILTDESRDIVLDALVKNISQQTIIIKKQIDHESNN
jgi:hypothetical protein